MAIGQPIKAKPKRTPDEWGMLKPHQLEKAVLMELNTDMRKVDADGNVYLIKMPPKAVFFPKGEVEAAKKRGYKVVEDAMHYSKYKPNLDGREPLGIELVLEDIEEAEAVEPVVTEKPRRGRPPKGASLAPAEEEVSEDG